MATLKIVFRKDKTNKRGECPIHFRITKDRKPRYIASGIMVPEQAWDEKNTRIRPSVQNSARLNALLQTKFAEVQAMFLESQTVDRSLSSTQIRDKVNGKAGIGFFPFADRMVNRFKDQKKIGTYRDRMGILNKLERFLGNRNASFSDITHAVLERFTEYMHTELENKTNTITHNLKFLKAVYNEALRKEVIEYHQNPFRQVKFKTEKTQKGFLTETELESLVKLELSGNPELEMYRDMFLFASETGGVRISDLLQLRWEKMDGSHVHFTTRKGKGQMSLKLPNRSLEIIERYRRKTGYLFPILDEDMDTEDAELLHDSIQEATAKVNKGLKEIAKLAGINKKVTTHIGRHTWATRALRKGIPVEKVSKLMGHSTILMTLDYAKIVNEDLDRAMDVFNS